MPENLTSEDVANIRDAMFCCIAATSHRCVKECFSKKLIHQMIPYIKQISADWKKLKPSQFEVNPYLLNMMFYISKLQIRTMEKLSANDESAS